MTDPFQSDQDEDQYTWYQVWYHKKSNTLATYGTWFNLYETNTGKSDEETKQYCDYTEATQVLKTDTWIEKTFEEWQNAHLLELDCLGTIFDVYETVIPIRYRSSTSETQTCTVCKKSIHADEKHYTTILESTDGDRQIGNCDPHHIKCEPIH